MTKNDRTTNEGAHRALYLHQCQRLRPWLPRDEYLVLRDSDEHATIVDDMLRRIETMPKTYETDGQGTAAMVSLHYFNGASDWYIIERDKDGDGREQCFGWVVLNGWLDCAELGYISVCEIIAHGIELDLHWTPRPLREIQTERRAQEAA